MEAYEESRTSTNLFAISRVISFIGAVAGFSFVVAGVTQVGISAFCVGGVGAALSALGGFLSPHSRSEKIISGIVAAVLFLGSVVVFSIVNTT